MPTATPMEVDAILGKGKWKGGKDKSKGKGKGKGKGLGKGPWMPSAPSTASEGDQGHQHSRACFGCGSTDHLWKDCPWNWSTWSSWQSNSSENIYVDDNGIKWVPQMAVGSIQQQTQQNESTGSSSTSTVQQNSRIGLIPPQPVQEARLSGT